MFLTTVQDIRELLQDTRNIAIMNALPEQESLDIVRFLETVGFRTFPVNKAYDEVYGLKCYPSLEEVPVSVDVLLCFLPADLMSSLYKDALAIGARGLWMQRGFINEHAASQAAEAGLRMVMNRCIQREYGRAYYDLD